MSFLDGASPPFSEKAPPPTCASSARSACRACSRRSSPEPRSRSPVSSCRRRSRTRWPRPPRWACPMPRCSARISPSSCLPGAFSPRATILPATPPGEPVRRERDGLPLLGAFHSAHSRALPREGVLAERRGASRASPSARSGRRQRRFCSFTPRTSAFPPRSCGISAISAARHIRPTFSCSAPRCRGWRCFSALAWRYNALLSGDAAAGSMGVNVSRLRFFFAAARLADDGGVRIEPRHYRLCRRHLPARGKAPARARSPRFHSRVGAPGEPAPSLRGRASPARSAAAARCPSARSRRLLGAPFFLTIIFSRKEHGQC